MRHIPRGIRRNIERRWGDDQQKAPETVQKTDGSGNPIDAQYEASEAFLATYKGSPEPLN
jgi:hypothetical protein